MSAVAVAGMIGGRGGVTAVPVARVIGGGGRSVAGWPVLPRCGDGEVTAMMGAAGWRWGRDRAGGLAESLSGQW